MQEKQQSRLNKLMFSITYYGRVFGLMGQAGKWPIMLICVLSLLLCITPSVSTLIMQEIINKLQMVDSSLPCIINLLILYVAIDAITSFASLGITYCESRFQIRAAHVVNMSILRKVGEFTLKDFENSETYDLLQRAMNVGIARMYAFFKSVILISQAFINVVLFSGILFMWKRWLVALVLLLPIINMFVTSHLGKQRYEIVKSRLSLSFGPTLKE